MGGAVSREGSEENNGYTSEPCPVLATASDPDTGNFRMYSRIDDNYDNFEQVISAIQQSGLESSNLIVGVDFTKSNEWAGKESFNGHNLHQIGYIQNPYEQAISIIGKSLSSFDEDNQIPCFGFGDASTHDQNVFSFYPDGRPCFGFAETLARYREIVPHVQLAGPTSFAPIIEMAISIVEKSRHLYHILLIIADGQVAEGDDCMSGHLSYQEQNTVEALVRASEFPLSIILVGVGDGPWDLMKKYDNYVTTRCFDNFQFVNFTEIMSRNIPQAEKEKQFALEALMEIPSQYTAIMELGLLDNHSARSLQRNPLPPPFDSSIAAFSSTSTSRLNSEPNIPHHCRYDAMHASTPPNTVCPICRRNTKDLVFGCGHETCSSCGQGLHACPFCRSTIKLRVKLQK
ncbi:E3 ubiquitin-protein ligase RGLG1-like isoform X2 [Typha latifolia]|uniref:E3 ubiquitin-protein ligase RGLG1-like isoform X2 n=1 Tax=Typha latifolia TaxID=4733 RepID=UPI003C2ED763